MQSPQTKNLLGNIETKGFTIIELMMGLAIIAIIAGIAAPSFTAFNARQLVKAQANDLQGFLVSARSDALTRKATVDVCWNFEDTAWTFPVSTGISGIDGVAGAQTIPRDSISSAIDSNPDLLLSSIALSSSSNINILPMIDGVTSTQACTQVSAQGFLVTGSNQVTFNVSDSSGDNQLDTRLTTTGRSAVRKHE